MRETPTRVTVPLPPAMAAELELIGRSTDLPMASLLRQGAVRIINEYRETKAVTSQALEVADAAVIPA